MTDQTPETDSLRYQMNQARSSIIENLTECAAEVLKWHETTILPDGHISRIARMLSAVPGSDRMAIVENMINTACLKKAAGML